MAQVTLPSHAQSQISPVTLAQNSPALKDDPLVQTLQRIIESYRNNSHSSAVQLYKTLDSEHSNAIEGNLWVILQKPVMKDGVMVGREGMLGNTVWDINGRQVKASTKQRIEAIETYLKSYLEKTFSPADATSQARNATDVKISYFAIGSGILLSLGILLLIGGLVLVPLPHIAVPLLISGAASVGAGCLLYYFSPEQETSNSATAPQSTPAAKRTIAEKIADELREAQNQRLSQKPAGLKYDQVKQYDKMILRGDCNPGLKTQERSIDRQQKTVSNYSTGIAETCGERWSMEDAALATHFSISCTDNSTHNIDLFGVFDGHGEKRGLAAQFLRDRLANALKEKLSAYNQHSLTREGIVRALKAAFLSLDQQYTDDDGSTASVAMIVDQSMIYCANLGDSRIALNNNGTAIQLTVDHIANDPRNRKAIEKRGGTIDAAKKPLIQGQIPVGRAFGDHGIIGKTSQCCIPHSPTILDYPLKEIEPNSHIILACDGLWDRGTTQEVVDAVHSDSQSSPDVIAAKLVKAAHDNYSTDNITTLVVKVK